MGVLEGQVALITGAARGMGRAIATAFAREGAAVGLLDIQAEELAQLVEELRAGGARALGGVADVRRYDQVTQVVHDVEATLGPIDILVNSAGLAAGGLVHETSEEAWDLAFDVNVKGTFLLCKAVVPTMLARQKGLIINIASLAAWIRGARGGSCYGATKYAVRGFSSYLAIELRPHGIKVCCLSPGTTDSHFRGHPTGSPAWMKPEDIAAAALYVASQRERVSVYELALAMLDENW